MAIGSSLSSKLLIMLWVLSGSGFLWLVHLRDSCGCPPLLQLQLENQRVAEQQQPLRLKANNNKNKKKINRASLLGEQLEFSPILNHVKPKKESIGGIIDPMENIPSTVYKQHEQFPCIPSQQGLMLTQPAYRGLLFQRPHKTGTTTMVGILLRLIHTRSQQQIANNDKQNPAKKNAPPLRCLHRTNHGSARSYQYGKRNKEQSFLLSWIRDPTSRVFSELFHFEVSAGLKEPTDKAVLEYIQHPFRSNIYLHDLTTRNYTAPILQRSAAPQTNEGRNGLTLSDFIRDYPAFANQSDFDRQMTQRGPTFQRQIQRKLWSYQEIGLTPPKIVVRDILQDYDFIGITERMDESLVVLQMLLGLTTKEILYAGHSRSSGSWSNGYPDRPCFYIRPSFITPGVKKYLTQSPEWRDIIWGDSLLYQAANKSLDRTIDALGRDRFEKLLAKFKDAKQLASQHCEGRVRTLCTDAGERLPPNETTCYIWSEGCDHECINELNIT